MTANDNANDNANVNVNVNGTARHGATLSRAAFARVRSLRFARSVARTGRRATARHYLAPRSLACARSALRARSRERERRR
jgi:hypothetical protein